MSGRLVPLELTDDLSGPLGAITIYAAHMRDRALGQASRRLLKDLKTRLPSRTLRRRPRMPLQV